MSDVVDAQDGSELGSEIRQAVAEWLELDKVALCRTVCIYIGCRGVLYETSRNLYVYAA